MAGIDSNTKLMLHMNGTDGSTTFTDSSPQGHIITPNGDAQIDTAQSVFGGASGLFDNSGDFLSIPDSSDWDWLANTTDSWTIDFRYRSSGAGDENIVWVQGEDANNRICIQDQGGGNLRFFAFFGGVLSFLITTPVTLIALDTWYHFACVIVGSDLGIYMDGQQQAYGTFSLTGTLSVEARIGGNFSGGPDQYHQGHLDEFRVQFGNYFNAAPNVLLTDTITVPTEEYSSDVVRKRIQPIIIM